METTKDTLVHTSASRGGTKRGRGGKPANNRLAARGRAASQARLTATGTGRAQNTNTNNSDPLNTSSGVPKKANATTNAAAEDKGTAGDSVAFPDHSDKARNGIGHDSAETEGEGLPSHDSDDSLQSADVQTKKQLTNIEEERGVSQRWASEEPLSPGRVGGVTVNEDDITVNVTDSVTDVVSTVTAVTMREDQDGELLDPELPPPDPGHDFTDRPPSGEGEMSTDLLNEQGHLRNTTGSTENGPKKPFSGKSTLNERGSGLSSESGDDDCDSINVIVRVRPKSIQESQRKDKGAVQFPGGGGLWVETPAATKSFTFNVTFEPEATQEDVFDNCGVKKLVEMALAGYSCTAFAFGQTGSGKTHTITGPPELFAEGKRPEPELYGLIPRSFHYLFKMMKKEAGASGVGYTLFASYMEIYNEQVIDLLNPNQRNPLAVRWSKNKGFYVENLFVLECETMDDVMAVLEEGLKNRATGSNSVNEHSSRSHSMLTLHIDSEVQDPEDEHVYITKHGKLTFVDLAGSEKVKTETQNIAGHLTESNNINKSLLVLGNCISALGDPKRRQGHIPYRDSKLTKLLSDSLGGNGVTLMISCVSPSAFNGAETMNTLRYANRAKKIKTKPAVKMDPREQLIMSLKREVKILRQENQYLRQQHDFPPNKRGPTQLEFPVKPRSQQQRENDQRFMKLLKEQQQNGGKGITDHGLYEMLQEYMIENETLRTENSDLHQLRDTSRREQQLLARENEKLLRKMDTLERERMMMQTPLSIYSVGSTASRQTSASELHFERGSLNGTPSGWGQAPPPLEYYGRDLTQGSWASQTMGRQPLPHDQSLEAARPQLSQSLPTKTRVPPAHLQHPMRPPHRLSEPVTKQASSGYGQISKNAGYMNRYQQQQDYYRDNSAGNQATSVSSGATGKKQGGAQQGFINKGGNSHNMDPPVPPPRQTKESLQDMNERLRQELYDLEGAIKEESHSQGSKPTGWR